MFATTKGLNKLDISKYLEEYDYQEDLTKELDKYEGHFDQEVINEIVLWKVNRYAKLLDYSKLNLINKSDENIDEDLTRAVMKDLLNTPGIRTPMASTILRFKNPFIYQIIDQRVYRVLYGKELVSLAYKSVKNIDDQIEIYMNYLKDLRKECARLDVDYFYADRVFYQLDIEKNKSISIKN